MKPDFKIVGGTSPNLPDPPYPDDFFAGKFTFDLDIARVNQSRTWCRCPKEHRPWLLQVWAQSWINTPAGTWENDDYVIADHIGMNPETFIALKPILMNGWYLCNDDRWYHPYIVKIIHRAIESREEWKKKDRLKRESKDKIRQLYKNSQESLQRASGETPERPQSLSPDSPPIPSSYIPSSSFLVPPTSSEADPPDSGKSSQVDRKDTYCAERKIALHAGRQIPGIPMVNGQDFFPQAEEVQLWEQSFPAVDIMSELGRMRAWADANPKKRKTPHGMKKFIIGWLGREQDKGGQIAPERKNRQQSLEESNRAAGKAWLDQIMAQQRTIEGECHEV